ncbi:alpha/beta hydrolase [Novosphingobium sp.]|uniref:alpha/beta hydrolase n=1 Tax=Novosphingobium sp. TaxID=1874826 RepID=UPI003D131406
MIVSRRNLVRSGAALALTATLPGSSFGQRPAAAGDIGDLGFVDPELRPFARQMQQMMAGDPPPTAANIPAMRRQMATFSAPPLASPAWSLKQIAGRNGAPAVPVYVINANPSRDPAHRAPAILHTHGGGFIVGDAKGMISALQDLAATLGCVIVSVDYRLAPETRWQGSVEDNYAGLKWLHDHADDLGVDRRRIAVMGESAGGGHAALLAIAARDRREVPLCAQILVYPMLDDRTCAREPANPHIGALLWTPPKNVLGWDSFLGVAPGSSGVPVAAVPARTGDLRGLPPTFIGVGAIDLFVDEDVTYAHRLIDAGVPTELLVVPGAFHGFDGIAAQTSVAKAFNAAKIAALTRAFAG